jgi:DNA polymerase I-like protein with 3'-5' exonuclease and polymerase domains
MAPKTAKTGEPSAAKLFLERMKEDTSTRAGKLADLITRYRSANDSRAEYLDVYIHTDGRVHPSWRQVETGRPATRAPNVLNVPKTAKCGSCGVTLIDGVAHGKWKEVDGVNTFIKCKKPDVPQPEDQLRDIYVAPPGHKLVYFDLSQAEMRMAAHISGDPVFIESCSKDIHTENACILFPEGADMIRADPKGKGFKFRDMAKPCGFAVVYLAEAEKIFGTLQQAGFDVSPDEVETMLNHLKSAYRVYYRYVDSNVELCRRQGYLRTVFHGRIRWLGRQPKPTTVGNFPVQSGVADVMNERLLELDRRKTKGSHQIIYQYDSAIFETPDAEVKDMERIIRDLWAEPIVIPHNGLSYVQKIDFHVGERLSDF